LGEKSKEAFLHDDGVVMSPKDYANYLSRVSYNLRNKLNPLYLLSVIAVINSFKTYKRVSKMAKHTLVKLISMELTLKQITLQQDLQVISVNLSSKTTGEKMEQRQKQNVYLQNALKFSIIF